MTPEQAADLAARTLAAIPDWPFPDRDGDYHAADRERVASDLAGLRLHAEGPPVASEEWDDRPSCLGHGDRTLRARVPRERCADATRYADGLRRTANLYGVTP